MSDSSLVFIPTQPTFRPTPEVAETARTLLATFLSASDEVECEFTDEVEFVDAGENWSGVKCPFCGTDVEDWWFESMDAASAAGFTNLAVKMPCCRRPSSLNDLNYVWPAGFSVFRLEALNPSVEGLADEQRRQLESCLGWPLRQIQRRI